MASPIATATLGDAVFLTHDGLMAEGNGYLSTLQHKTELVEFRSSNGDDAYLPKDGSEVFFLRAIRVNNEPAWLFGVVRREKDASGRTGFLGVCRLLDSEERDLSQHAEDVSQHFGSFVEHHRTVLSRARHPSSLGFIPQTTVKQAELQTFGEGAYHALSVESSTITTRDIYLMRRLAGVLPSQADTLILWPSPTNALPILTEESVVAKEVMQADMIAARQAERQHSAAVHPRQIAFDRRTHALRYPRPDGVIPEYEDYFIGLIQLVIEELEIRPETNAGTGVSGHRNGASSMRENFDSALSRSSFATFSDTMNRRGSWLSENLNMLLMSIAIIAVVIIIGMAGYFGYTILMTPDIAAPNPSISSAPASETSVDE